MRHSILYQHRSPEIRSGEMYYCKSVGYCPKTEGGFFYVLCNSRLVHKALACFLCGGQVFVILSRCSSVGEGRVIADVKGMAG